ncbi:MAG: hypothetical protein DRJ42_08660 [Deltaproteobacteria bacterium]|nr:MAG: hypothetical protein DRJ42_08660 [Deltaproteobacteria bacterium]
MAQETQDIGEAAESDASRVVLGFEGERCLVESASLSAAVHTLAIQGGPGSDDAPLVARVRAHDAEGPGVMLVLALSRGDEALGERRILGADCDEVLAAAALVLTLATSPDAELPEQDSLFLAPAAPPVAAGPLFGALLAAPPQRGASALLARPARSASTREHVEARRDEEPDEDFDEHSGARAEAEADDAEDLGGMDLAPSIGVSALLAVGELPVAAPGIEARFGFGVGPVRLEAAGRYVFDQEADLRQHPTGRVRVGLATGSVAACLPFAFGAVTVGPCAGLEVGGIWGESSGVTNPGAAMSPWVAPWATATATVQVLPWLHLRGDAGLTVPVVATDFVVDGIGVVHSPGAATFRLGIGAEVHFR